MNPRLWQLAVIGVAFGIIAAGSCAKVVDHGPYPGNELHEIAFLAGGVLGVVRWCFSGFACRAVGERPGLTSVQVLLAGAASTVLTVGSFVGFFSIIDGPPVRRRAMIVLVFALLVTSAVAGFVTLGTGALLAVGIVRRIRNPESLR